MEAGDINQPFTSKLDIHTDVVSLGGTPPPPPPPFLTPAPLGNGRESVEQQGQRSAPYTRHTPLYAGG